MSFDDELEASNGFLSEVRISSTAIIIALACSGVLLFSVSGLTTDTSERFRLMALAAFVAACAGGIWRLSKRHEPAARWALLVALIVGMNLALPWLTPQGTLVLVALPIVLAAPLINLRAAAAIAVVQTALVVLLFRLNQVPAGVLGSALASIWLLLVLMVAMYQRIYRVTGWAWDYFVRARDLLEEARARREELAHTFDDLAEANLQLTRLNVLAQGLRQAAEDARTAKEQFVANVSHELRTPLNMITGFSEMMLQSPGTYGRSIPPALLADLAVIQRNAEHLAALIDDVLDLSQIEADQMALIKEYVPLGEIIETAKLVVRPLFESKGLYLHVEIEPDLPMIFCDRTRIREVILNLLSNAGRFTEEGGVRVRAECEDGSVLVSVADTGSGIEEAGLRKLFQPFQQVDGSIRRRFGGTGLGLSISKRFIELHGGEIWVESQSGVGTTFYFRLPVRPLAPMSDDFSRWLNPEWEFYERTRPVVLPEIAVRPRFVILESGGALQRLLSRYMGEVELTCVETMAAALEELARLPAQALLINSTSVSRTLETLRAAAVLPDGIPVIVCSIPTAQSASARLGVAARLVKPIAREELLSLLAELGVAGGTVLVVDDEPDALQLFGRMLSSSDQGYRVLLARDGQEAINVLQECRPDVILLDLVMPNMDGFELLERRPEIAELDDIPIVTISARDPVGQPIISRMLAVTQGGGISVRHLLASIRGLSRVMSVSRSLDDSEPPERLPETPACG